MDAHERLYLSEYWVHLSEYIRMSDPLEPLYRDIQPHVIRLSHRYPDRLTVQSLGRCIVWLWTAEYYSRTDTLSERKDDVWHMSVYLIIAILVQIQRIYPLQI